MYAIADGRASLLSAVYTMSRAGRPGPTPGGPLPRWHAHNGCLSLLPSGFSVVDAYGGCPALSVQVTLPVMMRVWVVDNPGVQRRPRRAVPPVVLDIDAVMHFS